MTQWSGDRVASDNPLWIICCCGCLPIIGLIKSVFVIPPVFIIHTFPCFFIALIMLPHDIFYTYYTVLVTKKWGPNLKVLALLLLWAPLIAWPPFVLVITAIGSIIYGFGITQMYTFDDKYNLFVGGLCECIEDSVKHVKEFWKFNSDSYFAYLAHFRQPLSDGEVPFDIRIVEIFIGLFICLVGIIVDTPVMTLISALYLAPVLIRAYMEYFKKVWEGLTNETCLFCSCFPFVIIAFALVPVICVLVVVAVSVGSIFCGPMAAVTAYNDGIPAAFKKMIEWIGDVWDGYHKFVFEFGM